MDPSRSSQPTGTTVNSSPKHSRPQDTGEKTAITGKNQLGQQIRQKEGKANIPSPDHSRIQPHQGSSQSFDSVSEVKPQKNWLRQWFSGLFSGNKVETTQTTPKLPSNISLPPGQATDLEKRAAKKVETGSGGFWETLTNLPSWLKGKKVEPARPSKGVISPGGKGRCVPAQHLHQGSEFCYLCCTYG